MEYQDHIRMEEGYFGPDTVILLLMVLFCIPIDISNWPTNIDARVILVDGINKLELTNPYGFFVIGMGIAAPSSSTHSDLTYAFILLALWGFKIDWDLSTGGREVNHQRKSRLLKDPNAVLVISNEQITFSDPRSPIPQIRDAPMVTEDDALAVRVTGSQVNTEHQKENKDVFVYDIREYHNNKLVKTSKGRECVIGKNKSVKAVVQMKNDKVCSACKAARDELNPKTRRVSQPKKIVKTVLGSGKPSGTHYTIVARLVKKGTLK